MLDYIKYLEAEHRATREALIKEGKTYRSRFVAHQNGYLAALKDIEDAINQPHRDAELRETMSKWAERLKA